jgi:outer membrane protein assembly factor BamB
MPSTITAPRTAIALVAICTVSVSLTAHAGDFAERRLHNWHQWRGPSADGVGPHADPPVEWDEQSGVRWKLELPGRGNSTPIVWEETIFLTTAVPTERQATEAEAAALREANQGQLTLPALVFHRFQVLAIDRHSGEIRWQRTAVEAVPHEGHHPNGSYASASPVTDGRRVYVSFGSHGLFCYDFAGELHWQRDLGRMRTRNGWGEGASPALWGDTLVVNWDHEQDSFLVALDAATGEIRWRVQREEPTSWSTPLVVERPDGPQVIVSATNRVRAYALATGELLWECGGLTTNVIPSPVADARAVYCMSWYGESAVLAIPLDASGDLTDTDRRLWSYDRLAPYSPSPLLYQGSLYFARANSPIVTSLDVTSGETDLAPVRLPQVRSDMYASPVAAAGRVYFLARDGTMVVTRHGSQLDVLAANRLDDLFEASPAVVENQLFLRGHRYLYCLERTRE